MTKKSDATLFFDLNLPPSARKKTLLCWAEEYFKQSGEKRDRLQREEGGKPVFSRGENYLSVTHTENAYGVAFAPCPVGLDAEREDVCYPRVAARFFHEEEKSLPFARVWTAKEAVAKLLGGGLSLVRGVRVSEHGASCNGVDYTLDYRVEGGVLFCIALPKDEK